MSETKIFRPSANLAWGFSAIALDLMFFSQVVFYPATNEPIVIDSIITVLVAATAFLIWIRPKLEIGETKVRVVNPFRTEVINISDIQNLTTKWVLTIHHGAKQTKVWVAPTNGKQRWVTETSNRWRFAKLPKTESKSQDFAPMSSSHLSDSGAAATLIRSRMDQLH